MEIIVTMERMLKAKPESKWYFFRGVMGGDGVSESTIICKGCMGWEPQEMETLSLSGSFVEYKGERQFQFKHAKLTLPLDQRGMLHYVCQRTNGIGPATEEQIWNMYGEGWRHLQMGEIRKMSPITYANFQEEIEKFDNNKEHAEVISWLEDHGCSNAMAEAAYDRWKNEAPGIVTANCYRLAELPGFSFRTVDENVRGFFCIADDDPRRLKSGIEYAMLQEMEDGSTSVDCWRHLTACQKLLSNIGDDLLIRNVKELKETGEIYIFPEQNMMSLKKDYAHEKMVFDWIRTVKTGEPERIEIPDEVLFSGEKFVPDETQIEAVKFAISHKGAVINGGAGVGKTTVIKMIVAGLNLAFPELTVHLCAPTGKAAARLKEASGIHATTIHVLLGAHGNDVFTAGTLDRAVVIVDESSMVDSALMAEILKRRPARLILVGDQAQLTPVGHGQPFHDIIETAPEIVRTLTKCYRNTEAVFHAATQIRNGNIPERSAESGNERWIVTAASKPEEVETLIRAWVINDYLDFSQDIVLCPKNGKRGEDDSFQPATVNSLNASLLAIDRKKRGQQTEAKYLPGDRVINTVNTPEAQVWNGTTGTVHAVTDDGKELYIRLDIPVTGPDGEQKEIVHFDSDMVKNLRHAYALTVHKSQGSQYRKVIVVCLMRDSFQLDRSLIYTGVTRTRKECVIVGDYNAMIKGIGNVRKKRTVLQCLSAEKRV